jgi:hypothetical protein
MRRAFSIFKPGCCVAAERQRDALVAYWDGFTTPNRDAVMMVVAADFAVDAKPPCGLAAA